ncbi:MAG: hypothetical protein HC883_00430 [Bdellovibrionaceae bacterium]|nr:hypothetical protein [Pseudobdellovibrionaceae bacterium]
MKHTILSFLILGSCSFKQIIGSQTWSEKDELGLGLRVEWIKNKGDAIDASLLLTNRYPFEVVVPENSIQCAVDGDGTHSPRTNRRIVLPANGRRVLVVPFEFSGGTRKAKQIVLTIDRAHRGEATTETVTETQGTANAITASGWAVVRANERSRAYQTIGFKEGERLPSIRLIVTLENGE